MLKAILAVGFLLALVVGGGMYLFIMWTRETAPMSPEDEEEREERNEGEGKRMLLSQVPPLW